MRRIGGIGGFRGSIVLIALALASAGCGYIVVPDAGGSPTPQGNGVWVAKALKVEPAASGLHIDLAIENDTGDWSVMHAANGPARITDGSGRTSSCSTVNVGSGGHRLAPGFAMRGFQTGTPKSPTTQLLFVECAGVSNGAGAKLSIDYAFLTGAFDYYASPRETSRTMEVKLDQIASDVVYPAKPGARGIEKPDAKITAINNCIVQLASAERTATGFNFTWSASNPNDDRTYVHIASPVIGADGIVYGVYRSPTLEDAPITPGKSSATWTTTATVPATVKGLYILASIESLKQRVFLGHAIDITDK